MTASFEPRWATREEIEEWESGGATCLGQITPPRMRLWPYACTRDAGHEPPHKALGVSQVVAEWDDGDDGATRQWVIGGEASS